MRRYMLTQSHLLNVWVMRAVITWLATDDDAARLAALDGVITMASKQRAAMLGILQAMSKAMPDAQGPVEDLIAEVNSREWGYWARLMVRRRLRKANREYQAAICPVDVTVFEQRYPEIKDLLVAMT